MAFYKTSILKFYINKGGEISNNKQDTNLFNMNIKDFYKDKVIVLTGTTGFVGKVMLEKFLRSLPNFKKLYIMVRQKKNRTI